MTTTHTTKENNEINKKEKGQTFGPVQENTEITNCTAPVSFTQIGRSTVALKDKSAEQENPKTNAAKKCKNRKRTAKIAKM